MPNPIVHFEIPADYDAQAGHENPSLNRPLVGHVSGSSDNSV